MIGMLHLAMRLCASCASQKLMPIKCLQPELPCQGNSHTCSKLSTQDTAGYEWQLDHLCPNFRPAILNKPKQHLKKHVYQMQPEESWSGMVSKDSSVLLTPCILVSVTLHFRLKAASNSSEAERYLCWNMLKNSVSSNITVDIHGFCASAVVPDNELIFGMFPFTACLIALKVNLENLASFSHSSRQALQSTASKHSKSAKKLEPLMKFDPCLLNLLI